MDPSYQSHTFPHPLLGPVMGRRPFSALAVTHFRSLPFATVPARFRQAVLLDHIPSSLNGDFTEYGTACPAPFDEGGQSKACGGPLPGDEARKYDEFSCLNLTISAPTEYLANDYNEKKLLPVMVYVHGGGFNVGDAHVSALHDTTHLVDLSIKEGHPVIIVSIHYRLNWFGFLASQDLIHDAEAHNEPPCNYGLHDQRTAFHWIHRFIPGFGGDPSRITAFGESAGSGSLAFHMCSSEPLFQRAMLMSGTVSTCPPVELKYKEAEYMALLEYCGIDEGDVDRLGKLRKLPVEKLIEAVEGVGIPLFRSLREENFFPKKWPSYFTEADFIHGCEWVDEVVIGDSFTEGFALHGALKAISLPSFINLSNTVLGPNHASQILNAYQIHPDMDPALFLPRLQFLAGDIMFSEPADKLIRFLASRPFLSLGHGHAKMRKKLYRYTMLFLFGTLKDRYPAPAQFYRDVSDGFMKKWVRFGAGLKPWEEYVLDGKEGEGKIMVVEDGGGWTLKSESEDERESEGSEVGVRRYKAWEVVGRVMREIASGADGVRGGEMARLKWGTDGGLFRLAGLKGPFGVALP